MRKSRAAVFEHGVFRLERPLELEEGCEVEVGGYLRALAATIYSGITRHPGIRFGKACIAGTRLAVSDVVALHRAGLKPPQMLGYYDRTLRLAQVHAALDYYYDHPAEIEAVFAAEDAAAEEMEAQWEAYAREHGGNPPAVPRPEDRSVPRPIDAHGLVDALESLARERNPFAHPIRFVRPPRKRKARDPDS